MGMYHKRLGDGPRKWGRKLSGRGKSKKERPEPPSNDDGFGSTLMTTTLYEGKYSQPGDYNWVDFPPRKMSKRASKAQDRAAIKIYKRKDRDAPAISGHLPLKPHRIDIQNPALVAILEPILKEEEHYLDVNDTAVFKEPFRPLFFCYDAILKKSKSLTDGDNVKPFIVLLVEIMDEVLRDVKTKKQHLQENKLVSFKLGWTYFPRNSAVLSWDTNRELLAKVQDTFYACDRNNNEFMVIQAKVLRFNGEAFVWEEKKLIIPSFEGNKPIDDLPHIPLEFWEDAEETKARLTARGRLVLNYQGLVYRSYTGIGFHEEEPGPPKRHHVDGRILIDAAGYRKHCLVEEHIQASGIRSLHGVGSRLNLHASGSLDITTDEVGSALDDNGTSKPPSHRRLSQEAQEKNKKAMLEREGDLMFISPRLQGYALKNKLWVEVFVDNLRSLVWNNQAFDHLVYDEAQKDLIMSLVKSHGNATSPMEDVISGKGEGLIILLSGPPGTGKTLTAEAVADRAQLPLFHLQAEDLGSNATTLGGNIKKVFRMTTEWNAIILLDEADVFMAKRHPQDIARNELVSIFLRELEYFRGIIFLTTNLYSTIDPAFRSRVNMHLLFKPLTSEARLGIWKRFLDRLPQNALMEDATDHEISDSTPSSTDLESRARVQGGRKETHLTERDLKELAAWHLNGREIKSVLKMVRAWCDYKGYNMTLSRIEDGIKVTSPQASKQIHGSGDSSNTEIQTNPLC